MQDACRKERARAVTAVFGSLDVGSAVGLLVCGPLIHAFGWPSVFYLFAALGPAVVCGLASAESRAGRPRCASASTLLWAICRRHASPCELPLNGSPCHLANAAAESVSSDLLASCL